MVIVIIGLLAGVAVVSYRSTRKGAEIKTTRALVRQVEDALERYNLDVKEYPTEDQGLAALLTRPQFDDEAHETLWNGQEDSDDDVKLEEDEEEDQT